MAAGLPLRGTLRVAEAPGGAEQELAQAPARHGVGGRGRARRSLNLKVGDALLLGDASLRIAQVLVVEPDRGAGFLGFAPRVMLNQADLAATGWSSRPAA